jgi:hypothetical protein
MATYRKFHIQFWKDEKVQLLNPIEKALLIYLFTNESVGQSGIYLVTPKTIENETGIDSKTVRQLLASRLSMIEWCEEKNIVFVRSFKRYNPGGQPNLIARAIWNDRKKYDVPEMWEIFKEIYPEYSELIDAAANGSLTVSELLDNSSYRNSSRNSSRNRNRDIDIEEKENKEKKKKPSQPKKQGHKTNAIYLINPPVSDSENQRLFDEYKYRTSRKNYKFSFERSSQQLCAIFVLSEHLPELSASEIGEAILDSATDPSSFWAEKGLSMEFPTVWGYGPGFDIQRLLKRVVSWLAQKEGTRQQLIFTCDECGKEEYEVQPSNEEADGKQQCEPCFRRLQREGVLNGIGQRIRRE